MVVEPVKRWLCAAWVFLCLSGGGCLSLDEEVSWVGESQLAHYQEVAECIEFPDLQEPIRQVPTLGANRDLKDPKEVPQWQLSLAEAIHVGLTNNQVVRQNGQFLSPQNTLLDSPDAAPSIFDVVIQDNGVLFGSRGTPAAISDYDPKFTSKLEFGRDQTVPNSQFQSNGLPLGFTFTQNTAQFQSRLEQQLKSGGIFSLFHNWNYDETNGPNRLFPSAYAGILGAELRQPLWAGAGKEYTAVAGPLLQRQRGFSPVNQGVIIAQLNTKMSQVDFEARIQDLVREIGDLYWDLYLAYHEYEAEAEVRDKSQQTWDTVRSRLEAGIEGGSAAEEAQAADTYYDSELRAETALGNVYLTETRLRRLLGVSVQDGQLIRPIDAPIDYDLHPDRFNFLQEAYVNRLELRRQKTNIQSLRLQLQAARSLVNPRVDVVGGYQLNGFGHNLYSPNQADGITPQGYNSAYGSLFNAGQTSWNLGLEVSVPVFLRSERSQLRQLEFRLAKAQAALAEQELEIAHELTYVFQNIQRWLTSTESGRRREAAARRRIDAARADYDAGRATVDLLLRAQVSYAQALIARHRSLAEYNKTLWDLDYRRGVILQRYNIQICDGLLPPTLMSGL
jgi:outer membrane protein TolC